MQATTTLHYSQLYTRQRLGAGSTEGDQGTARHTFQRDFDRIVFSSAFRRLQNKTQVFPLPKAGHFVHNRLTHSLEVASVGRSLGNLVGEHIAAGPHRLDAHASTFYQHELGAVIAAACLAHDIGNPPFGHSGESAISQYFITAAKQGLLDSVPVDHRFDFTNFEGNANGFRQLVAQFRGRRAGGLCLTFPTLAATLKYPCESHLGAQKGILSRKKYGFFASETSIATEVAQATHMQAHQLKSEQTTQTGLAWCRHPFVFLTEAADDICYRIIDLEDGHRLGIVAYDQVRDFIFALVQAIGGPGATAKMEQAIAHEASTDHNEIVAHLRAKAINSLVQGTLEAYCQHESAILAGTHERSLIDCLAPEALAAMAAIDSYSIQHLYNHSTVARVEVAGYKVLGGLLEEFIPSVLAPESDKYAQKVMQLVPLQFQPIGPPDSSMSTTNPANTTSTPATHYQKIQSIIDFISGMTDNFALDLYRRLKGMEV